MTLASNTSVAFDTGTVSFQEFHARLVAGSPRCHQESKNFGLEWTRSDHLDEFANQLPAQSGDSIEAIAIGCHHQTRHKCRIPFRRTAILFSAGLREQRE